MLKNADKPLFDIQGRKRRVETVSDSESDSDGAYSVKDSSEYDMNFTESDNECEKIVETHNQIIDEKQCLQEDHLQVGQYLLVQFVSVKNTKKFYIGEIIHIDNNGITTKFLRSNFKGSFYYPKIDDISVIFISDIISILPKPKSNRRGLLKFDITFKYKIE